MTKQDAISMVEQYAALTQDAHILTMAPRMAADDFKEDKAMRWLGWVQGVLCDRGIYDLEDVKEHSRTLRVSSSPRSTYVRATALYESWSYCVKCRAVTSGRCPCIMGQDGIDTSKCMTHRGHGHVGGGCRCDKDP